MPNSMQPRSNLKGAFTWVINLCKQNLWLPMVLFVSLFVGALYLCNPPTSAHSESSTQNVTAMLENGYWTYDEEVNFGMTDYILKQSKTGATLLYTPELNVINFMIQKENESDVREQLGFDGKHHFVVLKVPKQDDEKQTTYAYESIFVEDFTSLKPTDKNEDVEKAKEILKSNEDIINKLIKNYHSTLIEMGATNLEEASEFIQKFHTSPERAETIASHIEKTNQKASQKK